MERIDLLDMECSRMEREDGDRTERWERDEADWNEWAEPDEKRTHKLMKMTAAITKKNSD